MANHNTLFNALAAITMLLGPGKPLLSIVHRLDLYPNIETIGVVARAASLPESAQLLYRQKGETDWRTGHPLTRIGDGSLVGSLFDLSPATSYEVRVLAGTSEFGGAVATQSDQLQFTPAAILHVDDDAPEGGDGSAAAPFRTIQKAVNRAGPGTQILVADGVYREPVVFLASGTPYQWIQVKAEGRGAVLDGSIPPDEIVWMPHPSKARVWVIKVASPVGYVARDDERFYNYDDLSGLMKNRGHGKVTIDEGWYFDKASLQLYIRSQDNPSSHEWRVSQFAHAFEAVGRDWIWIEGFEMQFYGRCGVCTLNASHLVVRANKIHNTLLGVFADWSGDEQRGNDTRIEENEIYDPQVNKFPWESVKGSAMEGTGIIVRGHIGAIVRDNNIHNYFNGIYTGSSGALQNTAVAFDADIYNNVLHDLADDALEPEGACVNHRFRNNRIDSTLVGISLAPITQGPTWVLRNVFSNYTSMGIKWGSNSIGAVYIYHNTGWTRAVNANAMNLITPVAHSVMRNNIFQSTGYVFDAAHKGSTGNDWDNDNWYTTLGPGLSHFKWEKRGYETIAQLCAEAGLECKGYEWLPDFADPDKLNFTLLPSSPNIDRGVLLPGINDRFSGNAPDIGAYEFGLSP